MSLSASEKALRNFVIGCQKVPSIREAKTPTKVEYDGDLVVKDMHDVLDAFRNQCWIIYEDHDNSCVWFMHTDHIDMQIDHVLRPRLEEINGQRAKLKKALRTLDRQEKEAREQAEGWRQESRTFKYPLELAATLQVEAIKHAIGYTPRVG